MIPGLLVLFMLVMTPWSAPVAQEKQVLRIAYLSLTDDPRHAEKRSYANIVLRERTDPFAGAQTAAKEAAVMARALGIDLRLARLEGSGAGALAEVLVEAYAGGTRFFLLDAPGDVVQAVAADPAVPDDATLFNVSAPDDSLREENCRANLFHVMPSRAMLSDALAQHAAAMNWDDVLVLHGPKAEDAAWVEAFGRSAARFGLDIVETREFTQDNDPRNRDRNNVALLTGGSGYDLIFVADADAEMGRRVAYRSHLPRPVIGTSGLEPAGWHWAYERHGAPQLNQRFDRVAQRRMTSADYGAWAAVSLISKAAVRARSGDAGEIAASLRSQDLTFDTYKGAPGSFRPWNNQLRQPVLLHTADAVVARAPVEGFLHPVNTLDTLGRDEAESRCHF